MDLLLPVFQLLYFITHFLVSVFQAVYDTRHDVWQIICHIYCILVKRHRNGGVRYSHDASKLPSHIALLLSRDYTLNQLRQLTDVLVILVEKGISCITVYDSAGKLQEQAAAVMSSLSAVLPSNIAVVVVTAVGTAEEQKYSTSNERGATNSVVVVHFTSFETSCRQMICAIQSVAAKDKLKVFELSPHLLHPYLSSNSCCSLLQSNTRIKCCTVDAVAPKGIHVEPELVLVVGGDYVCSSGFPPWLLRLSEFALVPRLSRLDTKELTIVLDQYGKVEQRFGR